MPASFPSTPDSEMISQYGDVYLRALDWSCPRSSLVSLIRNGLDLGKPVTSAETKSSPEPNVKARKIRHRIYETEYLARFQTLAEMRSHTRKTLRSEAPSRFNCASEVSRSSDLVQHW